jgi:hypothetical protein
VVDQRWDAPYSRGTTQRFGEHGIGKRASETEISNLEYRDAHRMTTLEFILTHRIKE